MTDISTYMSLTLARLCGEWRLVSRNYKARGASGGKHEAQIVILCILAAVNRFSWISRKAEILQGKLESRWRNRKAVEENRKAVEEIGKPLKKAESHWRKWKAIEEKRKAVDESRKPLKKTESRRRKSDFVCGKLDFRRRKIPIFPRDSLVSGNYGVSFLTPDLLPRAHKDLLYWTQVLIIWNNLL